MPDMIDPSFFHRIPLLVKEGKAKYPMQQPPFNDDLYQKAGMVTLCWGWFETMFHKVMRPFMDYSNLSATEPGWETKSFRRRKNLLLKAMRSISNFPPHLLRFYETLFDEACALQKHRNALVHGEAALRVNVTLVGPPELTIETLATEGDKQAVYSFTEDSLETLAYDIMHIIGRLMFFEHEAENVAGLGVTSHDIASLRKLVGNTHPSIPLPTTNPPQSSTV